MSCFRLLNLQKAIIGSTEKVFTRAILYLSLKWTRAINLFVLYWGGCSYMSPSLATPNLSVLLLVLAILSCRRLIFLISVSIEDES